MAPPYHFTAKWLWRDDAKRWKPFDAATAAALDQSFLLETNTKTTNSAAAAAADGSTARRLAIPGDAERFIEVASDADAVVAEFADAAIRKMKNREELVGVQRRYNDLLKRRPVRRVAPDVFADCAVCVLAGSDIGSTDGTDVGGTLPSVEEVRSVVEGYGGLAVKRVNQATTHVVVLGGAAAPAQALQEANKRQLPVLLEQWINDCLKAGKLLETATYVYSPPDDAASNPQHVADTEPSAAPAKRRAAPDDNTVSAVNGRDSVTLAPPLKKAKIPGTASAAPDDAANHVSAATLPTAESASGLFTIAPSIRSGTQWNGQATMVEEGDSYPLLLVVDNRVGNTFQGEVTWMTLSSKTKFRGSLAVGTHPGTVIVKWEEYEILEGDSVEIPVQYEGIMTAAPGSEPKIEGSVITSEPDVASDIVLQRLPIRAARAWDKLVPGKAAATSSSLTYPVHMSGVVYQAFPFMLEITERTGGTVSGFMNWQGAMSGARTRVRGTLEGDQIFFEEVEGVNDAANDLALPASYHGSLAGNSVSGDFAALSGESSGTFRFQPQA